MSEDPLTDPEAVKAHVAELVERVVRGEVSLLEMMRSTSGDYAGHVEIMRFILMVGHKDKRISVALSADLRSRMKATGQQEPDGEGILRALARRDGNRRFADLINHKMANVNERPSLLPRGNFDDCLKVYLGLIGHVEGLWGQACDLFARGNNPLSAFMSILVIEEVGKLSNLWSELLSYDFPPRQTTPKIRRGHSHRRKHFVGVVSGALINARLDRVLGKDVVRRFLHEAEGDEMERTRQACLYIDFKNGAVITPAEAIPRERAQELAVLSGEIMAEVLGHFPWEFERMRDRVIEFERHIGLPENKIAPK